ncbi:MAG: hypothetical protein IKC26_00445 [Clostridia bacterium]|nr:hypothetical protein [Clostridia bacterium]
MIRLFPKTRNFAILASLLWVVAVVVGRLTVFDEYKSAISGILSPLIAALCGVYIIYAFASIQASRMHRAYNAILSDECDADRYVALYEEVRERGRANRRTVFLTESSYATGLHLTGRSDEAREIVRALTQRPDFARQRAVDRADAYVDIGIYSVSLGDLPAAREAITEAEAILSSMMVGTQEYSRIYREVTRLRHRADIADGIYGEALEYFTDTSREYTVPYTKVNRMNTLADIYRATGDGEQLRKCLSYVARHGGTLYMAKKAREELEALGELGEGTQGGTS